MHSNGPHYLNASLSLADPLFESRIFDPDSSDELLFPAEQAYDRLFALLTSNSPWKVTPALLFSICRILEESLAHPSPAPVLPLTLVLVLRTMRTWRLQRDLDRLASDLARLVNVELSAASINRCVHRDENTLNLRGARKGHEEDKENKPQCAGPAPASYRRPPAPRNTKNGRTTPCSHRPLPDEPNPHFRRKCAACAMLHSFPKPQGSHRSIHPSQANPLSSSAHQGTNLDYQASLVKFPAHHHDLERQKPVAPLRALALVNEGTLYASDMNTPSFSRGAREDDTSLSEVWVKRHSQEDGWRP